MHLYSYRGVSYSIAPSSPGVPPMSVARTSPTPTAAIPMMYRGVRHLLARFHTPSHACEEACMETAAEPLPESAESANLVDES